MTSLLPSLTKAFRQKDKVHPKGILNSEGREGTLEYNKILEKLI
jgi:hypothetical protein